MKPHDERVAERAEQSDLALHVLELIHLHHGRFLHHLERVESILVNVPHQPRPAEATSRKSFQTRCHSSQTQQTKQHARRANARAGPERVQNLKVTCRQSTGLCISSFGRGAEYVHGHIYRLVNAILRQGSGQQAELDVFLLLVWSWRHLWEPAPRGHRGFKEEPHSRQDETAAHHQRSHTRVHAGFLDVFAEIGYDILHKKETPKKTTKKDSQDRDILGGLT